MSVDDRLRREAVAPDAFVLKGGLALELRLTRARTTRDVDSSARLRVSAGFGSGADPATAKRGRVE